MVAEDAVANKVKKVSRALNTHLMTQARAGGAV
jgi:hypothetical protein